MKRSSFLKSLIGLVAAPEIAKALPVEEVVVDSIRQYPMLPSACVSSGKIFTDLNMVIPTWIPDLMKKYGNDDYLAINQILGREVES